MDGPKVGNETAVLTADSIAQRGSGTRVTAQFLDVDAVEALHRAQASLRTLMDISADLVVVHRDGAVAYANAAIGRALGIPTSDVVGKPLAQIVHADDLPRVEARMMSHDANSGGDTFGLRWRKGEGSYEPTEAVVARIDFEGSSALVLVAHDVPKVLGHSRISSRAQEAHRLRMLVIDDDRLVAEAIARSLSREGEVSVVNGAQEALARIASGQRYDIVLCDLMMPVMTGMDFYAEVERVEPAMARRIVFMTGGAFTPQARVFVETVANTCLEKPLDMRKLRTLLAQTEKE